jgi:hypothetical protein
MIASIDRPSLRRVLARIASLSLALLFSTTDNVSATLFVEDGVASFTRATHHEPSERDQTFVVELPLRELTSVLNRAAGALPDGMG